MDEQLERQLAEEFPLMVRGDLYFAISDAWYPIIHKMLKELSEHCELVPGGANIKLEQVKSKFGQLRVYWSFHSDTVPYEAIYKGFNEIVSKAEATANHTCHTCGGWFEKLSAKSAWHDPQCAECIKD